MNEYSLFKITIGMSMSDTAQPARHGLANKLIRYGTAVGTGALLSPLAFADWAGFDPAVGLPIVIDTSNTTDNRVYIDLDGDADDDFSIYYNDRYGEYPTYGGGFVIEGSSYNRTQYTYLYGHLRATRNDLTEYVCVARSTDVFPDFSWTDRVLIDADEVTVNTPAYTPFRDKPGFLGLMLTEAYNVGGFAGTLKVVVNSNGTELTILKGAYRTDDYDLRLDDGYLHSDSFESPPASDYFPSALGSMAAGSVEGAD